MKIYQTKCAELAGTNFSEVSQKAFGLYNQIRRKTKRRPYVRSAYFKKDKIFSLYSGIICAKNSIIEIKREESNIFPAPLN